MRFEVEEITGFTMYDQNGNELGKFGNLQCGVDLAAEDSKDKTTYTFTQECEFKCHFNKVGMVSAITGIPAHIIHTMLYHKKKRIRNKYYKMYLSMCGMPLLSMSGL
ncbi:MAG: hypothetical protein ACRDD7_11850 [Peptostreptococcaceae bacterium]